MRVCDFRRLLAIGVFVAALTLVVQGASPQRTAVVKDVELHSEGESLEATITATGTARFTYFELDGPKRLVIDFHGLRNGIGFSQKSLEDPYVRRVRAAYFDTASRKATRVVFDLVDGADYEVVDEGGGRVHVTFSSTALLAARREANNVPLNLVAGTPVLAEAEEVSPALGRIKIEAPLTPETVAALQPPAEAASPTSAATLVAPVLAQLGGQISAAPPSTTPVITGPPQAQTFNGEIISLDLVDVEMREFFRGLGEFTGLNIVLDQNVTGRITVRLIDLPWDQALDIVLRNYNLGGQLDGNVLRIATRATLNQEAQARQQAAAQLASTAPLITRQYNLNYTRADAVAQTLMASGAVTGRGRVTPESRLNAVFVQDVPEQFDTIQQMVTALDVPAQQVEIEARLLAANKSFSREFGNQLGLLIGNNSGNVLTGGSGAASPFARTPPPRATVGGDGIPLVANLPAAATSGLAFLIQPGGDIILDEIITAAEASGTARLLSRPKVTTQNNQQAEISQGTQIPVQTNVNNTISVSFLNFALRLQVTPQIAEKGTVLLNVQIENSQPDFARAVNGVPSVSTQQAGTTMLVPDGATMMIGGILVDTDSLNIRQVPGLGSLPVIGHLFKNTQTIKSTAELLFFVTPRIRPVEAIVAAAPAN